MDSKWSLICDTGVCAGMNWYNAQKYIMKKHSYEYWEEWANKVSWVKKEKVSWVKEDSKWSLICDTGVCAGMNWYNAQKYIMKKHSYEYWEEWVNKVSWVKKER